MLPTIHPFGIEVSMYWLCGVAALLFGGVLAFAKRRAFGIATHDLLQTLAFTVIGIVGGAKIFQIIGHIVQHGSEDWFWTLDYWKTFAKSGGVFYGGLIGATGLVLLYIRRNHIPLGNLGDLMAYFALAFSAVARLGCFCAGCCYGVQLHTGVRFPSPLAEAGYCAIWLLIFLIGRPERKFRGRLFPIYMILYSAGRFILEFFRGDESRGVWILSTSQWIAIVLIAVAIVWLRRAAKRTRQSEA
jgi:phosphatidylglycerol:prolipoprotein diacylglycerol transferase